jgi:hypothetical protein
MSSGVLKVLEFAAPLHSPALQYLHWINNGEVRFLMLVFARKCSQFFSLVSGRMTFLAEGCDMVLPSSTS